MRIVAVITLVSLLGGCAALSAPSTDLIKQKPVVQMGDPKPEGHDYILYIPGGQIFPVALTVEGTLLRQSGEATTQVSLDRDLYLYQKWASYDGKDWQRLNAVIGLKIGTGMGSEGGVVKISAEQIQQ